MADNGHIIELKFEPRFGVYPRMTCSYDVADSSRPCWPHDEYGTPYDQAAGERDGCVYLDWIDELGIECLDGPERVLRFKLDSAVWDGDFVFWLGDFIDTKVVDSDAISL